MGLGDTRVSVQIFLQGLESLRQHPCPAGSVVQHYVILDTSSGRLASEAGFVLECSQTITARTDALNLKCMPRSLFISEHR